MMNYYVGTESVEPTDFQTCWNLVAASRRERKEKEKRKDQEEKDRKLQEEILWQKSKETKTVVERSEKENQVADVNSKAVKDKSVKSKVHFDESAEKDEEKMGDVQQNAEFVVPKEVTLQGILDAIEKEEQTD